MFPHRYEEGKRQFEDTFGLEVVEAPHALKDDDWLYDNPKARAQDLHWALENPEIKGIISTIGGDESVRILPYIDLGVIRKHPKVFMGFSDTTITLTAFLLAEVVSFYGPAILTDLAENGGIHPFVKKSLLQTLFKTESFGLAVSENWTEEFLDWSEPSNQKIKRQFQTNQGWQWLQGEKSVEGILIGGCIEVLEFLKGTQWWIPEKLWQGAIFYFETSEEAPTPSQVGYFLRNYGSQGILEKFSGILIGRPMSYAKEQVIELYNEVKRILAEFECEDMPVVANMDFGHTSPQMVMPNGLKAAIDPITKSVRVLEAPVS